MANVIIQREGFDVYEGLEVIKKANDQHKSNKIKTMQKAKQFGDKKIAQTHSHFYTRQDAAIREFASIPGRKAPGTWIATKAQGQKVIRVFCISCSHPTDYSPKSFTASGRLSKRDRCPKCGETTAIMLKQFNTALRSIHDNG